MTKKEEKVFLPLSDASAFDRRLKSRRRIIKSFQARANSNRSLTEKVADFLTEQFGSMSFLAFNLIWFMVWVFWNVGASNGVRVFDPFPFGLLTMIVSLEAIFLSIIVLISQNRAEKINNLRQEIDLQINTIAEEEITKMMELQVMLLRKQGIDISTDVELREMLEPTDPAKIERALEKEQEKKF